MPFIQPPVKPNPTLDLSGKTIIVTGGNAGLGFESARQFLIAKAGKVILACRTTSKGDSARQKLLNDRAVRQINAAADVDVMKLDMDSYSSVKKFADAVKATVPILHILLLNAGSGQLKYEKASTGHEKSTQVNFLSNALLALELLPLLEATAKQEGTPSRMSWVGSRAHYANSIEKEYPIATEESILAHFDDPAKYHPIKHYGDTKVLVAMFVNEMAEHVAAESVIINNMCPGMVKTGMVDAQPFYVRFPVYLLQAMRARTPEHGSWIIIYAAACAGTETHGRFILDKDVQEYCNLLCISFAFPY